MNYYERHIGDYAKDTGHLSMLEHGAYVLLMDRYYASEEPIADAQKYRLARAKSKEEKEAVDAVLGEFFTLSDGVWRQKRCDEVVAEHHAFIERQRANGRASAKQRALNGGSTAVQPPLNSGTNQTGAKRQPPTSHLPPPTTQDSESAFVGTTTVSERTRANSNGNSPPKAAEGNGSRAQQSAAGLSDDGEHAEWETVAELYPPGAARVDWIGAEHAARLLVENGQANWSDLRAGVTRYAAHVRATNRMVLNPMKFFTDRDKPWSQAWPLPPAKGPADHITWRPDLDEERREKGAA